MPSELIDQPADSRVFSELSRAVSLMQPPLVRAPFDATVRETATSGPSPDLAQNRQTVHLAALQPAEIANRQASHGTRFLESLRCRKASGHCLLSSAAAGSIPTTPTSSKPIP
jgi:hypothetical protein